VIPGPVLRRIPGCEEGQPPLSVQQLPGGRGCNQVWSVETPRGRFVLRMRAEPLDRPGSRAGDELLAHGIAAKAGLAPTLIDAAEDGRWLLMDHVADQPWSAAWLQFPEGLAALGSRLQQLHALPLPTQVPRVDAVEIARGYSRLILARLPDLSGEVEAALQAVEVTTGALADLPRRIALNHGDLQVANLVGPLPMLVDWEYAQWTDPTWDLACLVEYYPELQARLDGLLAACGLDSPQDRRILSLQQQLFAGLNGLWQLAETREAG
jgi:aminoglycoside phosphotransferase (APT) family kinase protein